ncbi:MAG: DUF2279 domain-containing protein [Kofleriaceae bacterium]
MTAVLVIAWLQASAVADPGAPPAQHRDPNASTPAAGDRASTAPAETPWIDLAPSKVLARSDEQPETHKLAAAATLAAIYGGFTTWTYFAWYRKHKPLSEFRWGGDGNWRVWSDDGWFGPTKYAGGADKLGHAWAVMSLARGGTELLAQWGGYRRWPASIVAASLAEALFIGVEVKDGFYYEFSWGDLAMNTAGAGLGLALSNLPRLDELIDFRVQYWPSKAYRRQLSEGASKHSSLNIAEDYSGETYMLAFHLGGIHALRDSKWGGWSRFVDVAIGFGTRGYKPDPPEGAEDYRQSQHLSFGISLNAQGLFDWLLDGRSEGWRKVTHGTFEVFNVPFGMVGIEAVRRPEGPVSSGGA